MTAPQPYRSESNSKFGEEDAIRKPTGAKAVASGFMEEWKEIASAAPAVPIILFAQPCLAAKMVMSSCGPTAMVELAMKLACPLPAPLNEVLVKTPRYPAMSSAAVTATVTTIPDMSFSFMVIFNFVMVALPSLPIEGQRGSTN